ncbi:MULTISPECIES: hypothetical protein [unclassified Halomonas]|uniref:hypothetical protein n=1 Tax=unclassified Halomonas TaxID=2609666 RepID=UPI0007D95F97|nr:MULTISPECIES: hypothetical protein [unclassified Halomonas]MBT2788145.1 hypothetical protein [Halomonas sp. ISL-106]MBT2795894.1 hypothetical protein [Halomonas sp. ISL-104]OAL61177.1 hypothetical protein A6R74_16405 [Halomonas sp. ALS9]
MSFKPTPFWLTALAAPFFITPLLAVASEATLSLPNEATVGVEVVEELVFESNQARLSDILLHPTQAASASHSLPEYCVIVGNAHLVDERIRVTTQEATCIETHDANSDIFTGEFSASAYGEDGQYGIACEGSPCTLAPGQTFLLTLDQPVEIEELDNPSEELNQQRQQANGEGVANPIPREAADPEVE